MTNMTEINPPTSTSAIAGAQFSPIKKVSVCDTQPVTAEGVRTLLAGSQDMRLGEVTDSLALAQELVRQGNADLARRVLNPVLYGAWDSPEKRNAEMLFPAARRETPVAH